MSEQQNAILGLAVAVNRYYNEGNPVIHPPTPRLGRYPVVIGLVEPDITDQIACHVLYGVGLRRRSSSTRQVWLETTPAATSARSLASRALSGLWQRGLLVLRLSNERAEEAERALGHGYVLSAEALAIGLRHERDIPDLALRLALLAKNTRRDFRYAKLVPAFLPSPDL